MLPTVKNAIALSWLLLSLAISGCATTLPNSATDCPAFPPPPALRQPMPPSTYSSSAQMNIERWHKRLTDTAKMPEN